jgi:hypothetical protein
LWCCYCDADAVGSGIQEQLVKSQQKVLAAEQSARAASERLVRTQETVKHLEELVKACWHLVLGAKSRVIDTWFIQQKGVDESMLAKIQQAEQDREAQSKLIEVRISSWSLSVYPPVLSVALFCRISSDKYMCCGIRETRPTRRTSARSRSSSASSSSSGAAATTPPWLAVVQYASW